MYPIICSECFKTALINKTYDEKIIFICCECTENKKFISKIEHEKQINILQDKINYLRKILNIKC